MLRRLFTAFALTLIASFATANEITSFFIERIEVRNTTRVSPKIVVAESLLREGNTYSEADLRAASLRLARLPFVLSSEYSLEKGSQRGRYILVISVTETKPFFFLLDARPTVIDDEGPRTIEYEVDPSSQTKDAALGFRWFVGGRGVVHAGATARRNRQAFTTNYSAWEAGYTQYGILGTRAFATFNLRLPFDSPAEGLLSPQFVTGIPLTTNQTLTLDYEDTNFRRDTIRIKGIDFDRQDSERLISLAWTYDTTNEPFIPTSGTIVRVAPLRAMRDRSSFRFALPNPTVPSGYAQHINGYGLDFIAQHYWELSDADSVSAGVIAGWADVEDKQHPRVFSTDIGWRPAYQIVRAGYARALRRDTRLEFDARVIAQQTNVQEGEAAFGVAPTHHHSLQTSAAWVKRTDWGTLRLGLGYAWSY